MHPEYRNIFQNIFFIIQMAVVQTSQLKNMIFINQTNNQDQMML